MDRPIAWKWKAGPFWTALIAYWLVAMSVSGAIYRSGAKDTAGGTIIFFMLAVLVYCSVRARPGTSRLWRFGFVIAGWLIEATLAALVLVTIGGAIVASGRGALLDRLATFLGSLPVVILAMRRCRDFVKPADTVGSPSLVGNRANTDDGVEPAQRESVGVGGEFGMAGERASCPNCAERILIEAKLCRYCRSELQPGWSRNEREVAAPFEDATSEVAERPATPLHVDKSDTAGLDARLLELKQRLRKQS